MCEGMQCADASSISASPVPEDATFEKLKGDMHRNAGMALGLFCQA